MRSPVVPGTTVLARGRAWNVCDVTEHDDCVALHLRCLDGGRPEPPTVLLHPFDKVSPDAGSSRPRLTDVHSWCRALASRLDGLRPFDRLTTPVSAHIDLLPFQLAPAIAVALHGEPRVLVADAVGLGKTIQAGLIVSELLSRHLATRVLVLVPASLRDQWLGELRSRFGLDALVVDASALTALAAALPRTVGPWMVPRVAIVSIDFAKRPEVRAGLASVPWDAVVIDEAHTASRDSGRYETAHHLAARAAHVVLLTATPHSGDDDAFAALTRIGARRPDDPLVVFRRTKRDVGHAVVRRSRVLRVRPGRAERRLFGLLRAYLRALWTTTRPGAREDARLVATLLLKRALSTPDAVRDSLLRRRALVGSDMTTAPGQLSLAFEDDDAADDLPDAVLAAPGLPTVSDETAWLDRLAAAAEAAVLESRKIAALERLVRRAREPVVVFTEYRDTLAVLERRFSGQRPCATLHGGLDLVERRASLAAFAAGAASLLLATDAAGVGLNLHERCRTVVTLELPWNPVRLEQRIGRVDRIGQRRIVHAVHLVGRGTPEEPLLARLSARARRARAVLGDDDGGTYENRAEADVAESLLGLAPRHRPPGTPRSDAPSHPPILNRRDLIEAAESQACTLARLRSLGNREPRRAIRRSGPVVATTRRPARRWPLASVCGTDAAALAIFEQSTIDGRGTTVDEGLIPFLITGIPDRRWRRGQRAEARRLVASLERALREPALEWAALRSRAVARHLSAAGRRQNDPRGRAVESTGSPGARPGQPGLFDLRYDRAVELARAMALTRTPDGARTSGPPELRALAPQLRWVLVQWPGGRQERAS